MSTVVSNGRWQAPRPEHDGTIEWTHVAFIPKPEVIELFGNQAWSHWNSAIEATDRRSPVEVK